MEKRKPFCYPDADVSDISCDEYLAINGAASDEEIRFLCTAVVYQRRLEDDMRNAVVDE